MLDEMTYLIVKLVHQQLSEMVEVFLDDWVYGWKGGI